MQVLKKISYFCQNNYYLWKQIIQRFLQHRATAIRPNCSKYLKYNRIKDFYVWPYARIMWKIFLDIVQISWTITGIEGIWRERKYNKMFFPEVHEVTKEPVYLSLITIFIVRDTLFFNKTSSTTIERFKLTSKM